MKTDAYTKIVLTVIAAALVGHLFKETPVISTAHAQDGAARIQKVDLVSVNGISFSDVISDSGSINQTNANLCALPVRVLND
ncbi:MAG: hypothetical protein ACKOLA_09040 [Spartobacteria bacterium]